MHKFRTTQIITRTLGASAFAASLALSAGASASQVQRVGNNYSPTGSDFSISALQGIDSSNVLGTSGAQVNLNFEMNPSIGVTYDSGNGQLTDFGLDLYTVCGS